MPDPNAKDILDNIEDYIVLVEVQNKEDIEQGTGFFIAPGWVLTCAHVVESEKGSKIKVEWEASVVQARLIHWKSSPYPDLALLYVEWESINKSISGLELGEDPSISLKTDNYHIQGFPANEPSTGGSLTFEAHQRIQQDLDGNPIATRTAPKGTQAKLLKFKDSRVQVGMSGSPILDKETGIVVGIIRETRSENWPWGGFGIPASAIQRFLEQIPKNKFDWIKAQQGFFTVPTEQLQLSLDQLPLDQFLPDNPIHTVLINNNLPFIGRRKIRDFATRLLKMEENYCLVLNGKRDSGRSYIRHYFKHLADVTNSFKLVVVDIGDIFFGMEGFITLEDLAKEISYKVGFSYDFPDDGTFKVVLFTRHLHQFISQSDKPHLFFFDNFHLSHSTRIDSFIHYFVGSLEKLEQGSISVVLADFDNQTDAWREDVLKFAEIIHLESFKEEEIILFLAHLFIHLSEIYEFDISMEEFITVLKQNLSFWSSQYFEPSTESNVPLIGKEIRLWLKALFRELEIQL